jgi:hypothetical protein
VGLDGKALQYYCGGTEQKFRVICLKSAGVTKIALDGVVENSMRKEIDRIYKISRIKKTGQRSEG